MKKTAITVGMLALLPLAQAQDTGTGQAGTPSRTAGAPLDTTAARVDGPPGGASPPSIGERSLSATSSTEAVGEGVTEGASITGTNPGVAPRGVPNPTGGAGTRGAPEASQPSDPTGPARTGPGPSTREPGTTGSGGTLPEAESGFGPESALERATEQATRAAASSQELRQRLDAMQAELSQLREQSSAQGEQLAALQQARVQDQQRQLEIEEARAARIALAAEASSLINRALAVLTTGSDDVANELSGAYQRFSEIQESAAQLGGEAEAREARDGLTALASVQTFLYNRDFQLAKDHLQLARFRAEQARLFAEAGPNPMGR
ncbi:MAG TPA: hypothetical protein VK447_17075 [Myxococcaceae bacterium]|nr:hypothetical protein [Myxococcaceae bacterium]